MSESSEINQKANDTNGYGTSPKKEPPTKRVIFEDLLNTVNGFGLYQILFMVAIQSLNIQLAANSAFMGLATNLPNVRCSNEQNETIATYHSKVNISKAQNEEFCAKYEARECASVDYKGQFSSIVGEWNLICSLGYVPEMINTIQLIGNVSAVLIAGFLADQFGRRSIFMLSFALMLIANTLAVSTTSIVLFTICRCIVGANVVVSSTIVFVWSLEVTGTKRLLVMNLANQWMISYIIAGLIGYVTRAWRLYLWVTIAIGIPALGGFMMLFVESPRWLIQKGRLIQAQYSLRWIARVNRADYTSITAERLSHVERDEYEKGFSYSDVVLLLSNSQLRKYLLTSIFILVSTQMINTSYVLHVSLFAGDPALHYVMYGIVRSPVAIVALYADQRFANFGRVPMLYVAYVSFVVAYAVDIINILTVDQPHISMTTSLISACMCSVAWLSIWQLLVELFPTVVRTTALSMATMCEAFGGVIVPQLIYMEEVYWKHITTVLLFVVSIIGLSLIQIYPETKGRILPEHMEHTVTYKKEDDVPIVQFDQLAKDEET